MVYPAVTTGEPVVQGLAAMVGLGVSAAGYARPRAADRMADITTVRKVKLSIIFIFFS